MEQFGDNVKVEVQGKSVVITIEDYEMVLREAQSHASNIIAASNGSYGEPVEGTEVDGNPLILILKAYRVIPKEKRRYPKRGG